MFMSDLPLFSARYRRFLQLLTVINYLRPRGLRYFLGRWCGRLASPYRMHAGRVLWAIQSALGVSDRVALGAWRRWRESHAQFCLSAFNYEKWSPELLQRGVVSNDLPLLYRAASTGGLLMTYHSHHHNSLFCLFGFAGARISVLAASEEGSPLFPTIGRYIQRVNRGSALHFGGGRYVFTDALRSLVKVVKTELEAGALVASLCDFPGGKQEYDFLGRRIAPPTGAITIALKQKVPIYTAILYGGYGEKPVLRMAEIDCSGGESSVISQYFDFLADVVRAAPCAWQGWDWFLNFPQQSLEGK